MKALRIVRVPENSPEDVRPSASNAEAVGLDRVEAWLALVVRLLALPEAQRREIADELRDHLRQRVRDLLVSGIDERSAVERAIEELGDAATLARAMSTAQRIPFRRRVMSGTMIGMGVVAAAIGVAAMTHMGADPVGMAVFQSKPQADVQKLEAVKINAKGDMSYQQLFEQMGQAMKVPVAVRWKAIGEVAPVVQAGEIVQIAIDKLSAAETIALLNDENGLDMGNALDWRLQDGRLSIATTAFFDRQETTLVTYDLSNILKDSPGDTDQTAEDAILVITNVVYPDLWQENGGNRASVRKFGSKLFVTAPKRLHEKVAWVIEQMKPGAEAVGNGWLRMNEMRTEAVSKEFRLKHVAATQFRAMMDKVFDVPGLKECDVPRAMAVNQSTNTFVLKATADNVATVSRIVEIVDTEYVKERAESASQTFHLAHMKASTAREVLLALFDAPGLKQCEVERVWEVLPGTGQELLVTATRGQVERVAALIREIDVAKPGEAATGGKGRGAIGPAAEEAPFQLAAMRRVSVPLLSNLPILNRAFVREEPTSILIEAKGGVLRVISPGGEVVEAAKIEIVTGGTTR